MDDRRFDLAQANIARLRHPLASAELADFVAAIDDVNHEAAAAPGFRWRFAGDQGHAFAWDVDDSFGVVVNLSTWTDLESLRDFVVGGLHGVALRRRTEWFQRVADATTVLWWVPRGHRPSLGQAEDRLRLLRESGPTEAAFTLARPVPEPTPSER